MPLVFPATGISPPTRIAVTDLTTAGVAFPAGQAADAVNGNLVVSNDGAVVLFLGNADSSAHTVTVSLSATVDGQAITPRVYSLAAGAHIAAGPWPVEWYGALSLSSSSSLVTVAAVRL